MTILKRKFNKYMKTKVKPQSFDPNACGLKKEKDLQNIFSISKKEITVGR